MNKVLVIDDDKELCALIKRSVLTENIEADCCNSGKEGLEKLREKDYQLVVLDVMMPGMDGFETLEQIRKLHYRNQTSYKTVWHPKECCRSEYPCGKRKDLRSAGKKCSKIHTESMIHYLEDYMYCTRKLRLYVQLVA